MNVMSDETMQTRRVRARWVLLGAALLPAMADAQTAPPGPEIVVTAQKRSEKLSSVPIAIGVVSGAGLEQTGEVSLAQFAGLIPSLTVSNGGTPGQNTVIIRGLSTSSSNVLTPPMVTTYIDDNPVGATVGARAGFFSIDLMPYDLDHIEVLRGPQGTLYGAGAMGGLLKYVLKKPDLNHVEGRVGADIETIDGSGEVGYGGRAAINLPIVGDKLAIRASGYFKQTPGYIDNIGYGRNDANASQNYGGRVALRWRPAPNVDIVASAIFASIKADDNTFVSFTNAIGRPTYGDLIADSRLPVPFDQKTQLYSLDANWDVGFATLTSATGYSKLRSDGGLEMTPASYVAPYPGTPEIYLMQDTARRFTQELRLASPDRGPLQWMIGGYFSSETTSEVTQWTAYDQDLNPLPAPYYNIENGNSVTTGVALPPHYQEWAVFGNATYKLTDRFDLSGGIRYAVNRADGCFVGATGLYGNGGALVCQTRPSEGVATWMGNLRYRLPGGTMFYARVATGYRPGGGCATCGNAALGIPGIYSDDRLINYEIGYKGDYLGHRLQIDLTGFTIDWTSIQLQIVNAQGFPLITNAGSATSTGVEFSGSYRLVGGLRLGGNFSYVDAKLTSNPEGVDGRDGDPLPGSAKVSGAITADYTRELGGANTWSLGGSYRYKGIVYNQFESGAYPDRMGPQNVVSLYAGLKLGRYALRAVLDNVFDNRSYTGMVFSGNNNDTRYVPIQPRTGSLSVDVSF
jgi:iron complex outermembrane recepter protein